MEDTYISLQEASKYCSYTQEYLSLRARQGKLKSVKFGRNWVTKKEWLEEYFNKIQKSNIKNQKFVNPPENLPIEKLPVPKLRFAFVTALVFVLLTAGIVFSKPGSEFLTRFAMFDFLKENPVKNLLPGKDSLKNVYQDLSRVISNGVDSTKNIITLATEGAGIAFQNLSSAISTAVENTLHSSQEMATISVPDVFGLISENLKEFSQWLGQEYLTANDFVERKISQGIMGLKNIPEIVTRPFRPKTIIVEKLSPEAEKNISELQGKVKELEEKIPKEVVKEKEVEVSRITKIEPIKEITRETIVTKIDEAELAKLKTQTAQFSLWGTDIENLRAITKKLQATPTYTPAPSAPIYIGYQGIQVGGTGTFASLGVSGSAGIGDLGVGGSTSLGSSSADTLTVNAASYLKSPVTFGAGALTIDTSGNLATTGTLTATGAISTSGNLSVTGNATITGTLTTTGGSSFSSPIIVTSTTTPQLSVRSDATNKLDTSVSATGEITLAASGALVETFPTTGSYNLKRGTEAILAVDANGALTFTARGTDQNITLAPSGTGQINFYTTTYYMNSGGDLVLGGRFTFENAEYI